MSQRHNKILNAFFRPAWWVSVLLAFCAYITLKYIIPALQTDIAFLADLGKIGPYFAPFVALVFLLPAPFSLFKDEKESDNEPEIPDEK